MSRTLELKCQFCGDNFMAERITAKFCKPSHRVDYNRLEGRVDRLMHAALDYMWDIEHLAKKHPHLLEHVTSAMQTSENYISDKREKLQQ